VIAGNVSEDDALAAAMELFGEIPAGARVAPVSPRQFEPLVARHLVLEDRVELPRLYLAWHSPALFAAGDAELDLVGDIVGNGRTSRLYRRLIHDRRIAVELAAGQTSRELGGTFQIVASAAPGQTLDDLEAAIFEELDRFADAGPTTEELERGRAQAEAAFVYRVQSLGGFGGKADQLNAYNVYRRSPDSFDSDLSRYLSATSEDLRTSAASALRRDRAISLAVVPKGHPELAPAGAEPVTGVH